MSKFWRNDARILSGPVTIRRPGEEPVVLEERTANYNLRSKVYKRDAGQCQYCGKDVAFAESQIDHVHPWYHGGKTQLNNLVLACKSCNGMKGKQLIPRDLQPSTTSALTSLWRRLDTIAGCSWPVEPSESHRIHIWDYKQSLKRPPKKRKEAG